MRAKSNRLGIQSVENAGTILKVMTEAGKSLPLKELAARARMHPGKVHRYLVSLIRTGLAEQDASTSHYGLGPMAIAAGLAALRQIDVVRCASDMLAALRDEIGQTVGLAVWSNRGPVAVRIEQSGKPVHLNVQVGSVLPVLRTATGRVLAAFLPPSKTREVIEVELAELSFSEQAPAYTAEQVEQLLADVRSKGLASVKGDLASGVSALAAPVFDHEGTVVASIVVLGQQDELSLDPDGDVAGALRRVATDVSKRLGFFA